MTKYVALLRGIAPTNPNMKNEKLRQVFEELGFKNVQSVISSGNVLFESDLTDVGELESVIEGAWPKKLGFNSTTIIRTRDQIQAIVDKKPFGNAEFSQKNYQIVTFLKKGGELFNVVDTTTTKTPNIMIVLDKKHGKEITTRTWKTVLRILTKLDQP